MFGYNRNEREQYLLRPRTFTFCSASGQGRGKEGKKLSKKSGADPGFLVEGARSEGGYLERPPCRGVQGHPFPENFENLKSMEMRFLPF